MSTQTILRITQVENGLVRMDANAQPQWGSTATLAERMGDYLAPGVSIAVIDDFKLDWSKAMGCVLLVRLSL